MHSIPVNGSNTYLRERPKSTRKALSILSVVAMMTHHDEDDPNYLWTSKNRTSRAPDLSLQTAPLPALLCPRLISAFSWGGMGPSFALENREFLLQMAGVSLLYT